MPRLARAPALAPVLLPLLLLAGCADMKGAWPSLAPRPGEIGPGVAGSVAAVPPLAPAPSQDAAPALPPGLAARLATAGGRIDAVAASLPPLLAAAAVAERAAAGAAPDSQAAVAATVAQSRVLDALAPLVMIEDELDAADDLLAGVLAVGNAQAAYQDATALAAQLASARARVAALRLMVMAPPPVAPPAPPCRPPACPVQP